MEEAILKKGEFGYEKIRYKDYLDLGFWGIGVKEKKFEWQREFRFFCSDGTPETPLELEIGDISDIAIKISIDDLFNRDKFEEIFGHSFAESDLPSFVEEDILVNLYAKINLEDELKRRQSSKTNEFLVEAQKYINEDIERAMQSMEKFVLATQEEPYRSNCLPILSALTNYYIRLAEDYDNIGDYFKTQYYVQKFLTYLKRANMRTTAIGEEKLSKLFPNLKKAKANDIDTFVSLYPLESFEFMYCNKYYNDK